MTDQPRCYYKDILRLGLPILVGQLGMIVVGFADTFMVGRYSTEALAAASFVNNVFNVAILGCMGFTYGLTPLVGALFARDEQSRIGALVKAGVIVNLMFALCVTGVMCAIYFFLDSLGQPPELLPVIRPYYLTYLAGIVPVAIFNVFAQWCYGIKRTGIPMWIVLAANMVNIALNWLLIYGNAGFPEWGLTGAGVATLTARVIAALVIMGLFARSRSFEGYRRGFSGRVGGHLCGTVFNGSWPVSLQMALETGAFSGAAVMAGWLGALELASFQLMVVIGTLGFCIYYSVAAAVSVLVANEAGLGRLRNMRRVALDGYVIVLALAACSSAVFYFMGERLIELFTDDRAVVVMASGLIVPLLLYQFADATQINFANSLRGTSRVRVMSVIAFVSYVVVGLPSTYILAFPCGMGIYGIILSFSVSLLTAAGLFLYFFMRYTKA